jgi:TetR/AcrR family transcriptional regulator, cholesterol catabolism regulator
MKEIIHNALRENSQSAILNSQSAEVSRHDQKLEFILRTAARIFAEKGYHSTSMRDISRETSVSLAGLYHYCKSKEELLFLIQDNCFGRVLERLEERLEDIKDPVQQLRIFVDNHLAFFAANMAEMKVLSHEADSLAGDMHARVSGKKQKYTTLARRILAALQEQQQAKERLDLTVGTYALFGIMNWIYNWYDPRGKLKVAGLVENVIRLFLTGFVHSSPAADVSGTWSSSNEELSVWRAR